MLEVANLVYEYPGVRALDGVSFRIERGSITALVGPNGAGKTTLMRCLAGLDQPLAGSIQVADIDVIEEPRRSHRLLGYLSDSFGLYDTLSVRRSLSYVAQANGIEPPAVDRVVTEISAALGLAERLELPAGQLSRGQRQRLAIAQAIIHSPAVVILDEPASGLDPEARVDLGQLFVDLRRRGMTLLVSSHILAELEAYSTHMLILRDGRVVEHRALSGTTTAVTTLEIESTDESPLLRGLLLVEPEVSNLTAGVGCLRFDFAGTRVDQAALLRRLIAGGAEVIRFTPVTVDLQQSYLQSIGRPPEPRT